MACIACENYAKRITNVFRDEELKDKFEKLIRYEIVSDCFICDECNEKLIQATEFMEQCTKIYQKNNPNSSMKITLPPHNSNSSAKADEIYILETNGEVLMNNDSLEQNKYLIENEEEAAVGATESFTIYEFDQNSGAKEEVVIEKRPKRSTRKSPKIVKTEKDVIQEYSIMDTEGMLESEDNFLSHDDASITNDDSFQEEYNTNNNSKGDGKTRKSYTAQQKLEIIEYAEKFGNRKASRNYTINESSVRCFRRQKDLLEKMSPTKSTNRHGSPYWKNLELQLKLWTEKQTTKPKISEIQKEGLRLAKELGYDNFRGSTSYIFKFMQRNGIASSSPRKRNKLKLENSPESFKCKQE